MLQGLKEKGLLGTVIAAAGGAVTLVAAIIGMWLMFQDMVKDSVTESIETVTLEVRRSTRDVVELFVDDLHVRERVLNREIEFLEDVQHPTADERIILERKRSNRDDIKNQIKEIEKKWP